MTLASWFNSKPKHEHTYDKWAITQDVGKTDEGRLIGRCVEQRRTCETCGWVEIRKQDWDIYD